MALVTHSSMLSGGMSSGMEVRPRWRQSTIPLKHSHMAGHVPLTSSHRCCAANRRVGSPATKNMTSSIKYSCYTVNTEFPGARQLAGQCGDAPTKQTSTQDRVFLGHVHDSVMNRSSSRKPHRAQLSRTATCQLFDRLRSLRTALARHVTKTQTS